MQAELKQDRKNFTRALTESAVMLAIGVVLSLLEILKLPYGGSVTLACMLPVILISYRHGIGWGLLTGLAFGIIEQLLGLKNLTYVTGWQSVVAVIVLDYLVAYAVTGLGGIFRKIQKNQALALLFGALLAGFLRFLCHFISGATVWAGLSIPNEAAALYSLGYNATYMVPETIILAAVAYYIGLLIDFRGTELRPMTGEKKPEWNWWTLIGSILLVAGFVFLTVSVFSKLQNPESGEFDATGFKNVNWLRTGLIFACTELAGIGTILIGRFRKPVPDENKE